MCRCITEYCSTVSIIRRRLEEQKLVVKAKREKNDADILININNTPTFMANDQLIPVIWIIMELTEQNRANSK